MGEPSPQVTQAGLGRSPQGNLLTSGGSAAARGCRSSRGLAPGRVDWIFGTHGAAQHPNSCLPVAATATPEHPALLQPPNMLNHAAPRTYLNTTISTRTAQMWQPGKQRKHFSQPLLMERSRVCLLFTEP